MLKHKIILMILSIVFGLGMLYEVIGIAVAVYVNVILDEHVIIHSTDESNYGYTVFHTIENSGLPIPIKGSISYHDTIFRAEGFTQGYIREDIWPSTRSLSPGLKAHSKKIIESYDSISYMDTSINVLLATDQLPSPHRPSPHTPPSFDYLIQDERDKSTFDIARGAPIMTYESEIYIKPRNRFQFLVLLVRVNIIRLIFIYIYYQLFRSVNKLNKTLSFSINLAERLKNVGLALLLFVILQFSFNQIIRTWYDNIRFHTANSQNNKILDFVEVTFRHRVEFNLNYLIAGAFLITLSYLVKKSSQIEEDWSLMI